LPEALARVELAPGVDSQRLTPGSEKERDHLTAEAVFLTIVFQMEHTNHPIEAAASATSPSLGSLLTRTRAAAGVSGAGLSLRELARRSGVSVAQVSRIEAGQVHKPSREILVALARALDRNPIPLLILAGHLNLEEARQALQLLFREGAELPGEWGDWATFALDDTRRLLNSPDTPTDQIDAIAADVFFVAETEESLWNELDALALARGSDATELRELMGIWRFIGAHRSDLLEYGRSLRRLADLEFQAEAATFKAEAARPGTRTKTDQDTEPTATPTIRRTHD
jgi:transcriptional regulator with XRE-family HTH domain